jgi:hypothetical protein
MTLALIDAVTSGPQPQRVCSRKLSASDRGKRDGRVGAMKRPPNSPKATRAAQAGLASFPVVSLLDPASAGDEAEPPCAPFNADAVMPVN